MAEIASIRLMVGLEVHVELSTRTKMFSRAPSPAHADHEDAQPNTLIDPVVLGLPGALPVLNKDAIEKSMRVGLALGCRIAEFTKWDRKSYFYPDLPKNYQISQYDLPLCADGAVDWPIGADRKEKRIRILRAHLEEDAGKLLHELPGGFPIDYSIVDLNRAGTPLLEIVTEPDFETADEVTAFAEMLRSVCRFLGVTQGIMQKGHIRFEPNINTILTLKNGRIAKTPIVEIKNLNSFKALRGAVEYEHAEQPRRWLKDQIELSPGTKSTRGWDDVRMVTVLQREKEEAHDYRYFPDPDLLPVTINRDWVARIESTLPVLPHVRARQYESQFGLSTREVEALLSEPAECFFFDECVDAVAAAGLERERAGKLVANLLLQAGRRLAGERAILVSDLGVTPAQVGSIIHLRQQNKIGSSAADQLFEHLCTSDESAEAAAEQLGLLQVLDTAQLDSWCAQVIDDPANAKAVEDVRSGKDAAIGRLVGALMKTSGGKADAQTGRELLIKQIRG